jgi:hypothetical protein
MVWPKVRIATAGIVRPPFEAEFGLACEYAGRWPFSAGAGLSAQASDGTKIEPKKKCALRG